MKWLSFRGYLTCSLNILNISTLSCQSQHLSFLSISLFFPQYSFPASQLNLSLIQPISFFHLTLFFRMFFSALIITPDRILYTSSFVLSNSSNAFSTSCSSTCTICFCAKSPLNCCSRIWNSPITSFVSLELFMAKPP